jgi:hypothetical protein
MKATAADPLATQEKCIKRLVAQNGSSPDALIEVLHQVQGIYGYLPETALGEVARQLQMPLSRVYGVASFYNGFSTGSSRCPQLRAVYGHQLLCEGSQWFADPLGTTAPAKAGWSSPCGGLGIAPGELPRGLRPRTIAAGGRSIDKPSTGPAAPVPT